MTVEMPKKNLLDWILGLLGKERGIRPVGDAEKELGPHVYIKAGHESFWKALLRRRRPDADVSGEEQ